MNGRSFIGSPNLKYHGIPGKLHESSEPVAQRMSHGLALLLLVFSFCKWGLLSGQGVMASNYELFHPTLIFTSVLVVSRQVVIIDQISSL